jgi:hypothetical protein
MIGLLSAIGEALGIVRSLTDPAKRKKAYELALQKRARKALETAERICFLNDEHIHEIKQFLTDDDKAKYLFGRYCRKYKILRKKFFIND